MSFTRRYQYIVAFNSGNAKLPNPVVRRALNMAIDRESIVKDVLHGYGVAATGPIWPKYWAYDPSVEPFPFDVPEASGYWNRRDCAIRAFLAIRRFRPPVCGSHVSCRRVSASTSGWRWTFSANSLKSEWTFSSSVVPFAEYNARSGRETSRPLFVDMISAPSPGRPYIFWRSAREGTGFNTFGYENAEAEELFQALRASTTDLSVRNITHRPPASVLEGPARDLSGLESAKPRSQT